MSTKEANDGEMSQSPIDMRAGAFVLMDCLGFRGIWKRVGANMLLSKISKIQEAVEKGLRYPQMVLSPVADGVDWSMRLLSDTVAISIQHKEPPNRLADEGAGMLVNAAMFAVSEVIGVFIADEPALTMRGCVTFGDHVCKDNFLIGPAVDEAAEHMNSAQGAFVWLTPEAKRLRNLFLELQRLGTQTLSDDEIIRPLQALKLLPDTTFSESERAYLRNVISSPDGHVIESYPVPFKAGGTLMVDVINPLFECKTVEEVRARTQAFMNTFSDTNTFDVWQKKQNTMFFLEEASRITWNKLREIQLKLEEIERKRSSSA